MKIGKCENVKERGFLHFHIFTFPNFQINEGFTNR
jgi:hypothetical protein